ncbi:hypothetical protein BDV25DRAFT_163958 [Aspergillus avenaceus]|uniref:Uncharacterized protein n=1 Tax=Aspergillus avenaceus TaxID=36643 RepID=A0A5N6THL7_ASPAV|nr:hypothetical protein BDV25DRAFT_163958 [Aspergillus avenaceus]
MPSSLKRSHCGSGWIGFYLRSTPIVGFVTVNVGFRGDAIRIFIAISIELHEVYRL